jgi:hypothetical protein
MTLTMRTRVMARHLMLMLMLMLMPVLVPVLVLMLLPGMGLASPASTAHGNELFATPEAAMTAFGDAVVNDDERALQKLFGSKFRDIIPPVGAEVRDQFLTAWSKTHAVEQKDDRAYIDVGDDGWTFPIPLVKGQKGWQFDTLAGVEEMRVRRVGRNELSVIQTMLAITDAQAEYARTFHDGGTALVYASKLSSTPGKQDGLYWPTAAGAPPSPLGPAFSGAGTSHAGKDGYYGYHYKLLNAQGPNAPGGAYSYLVNGRLFGGFAVLAWPVRYQDTGVMSFMISHDGQVYERDLGADSTVKAREIKIFDPGPGWRKVSP